MIRYYIDPETNEPHIFNHSVEEYEVEDILEHENEDRPGRDGSRVAIGQTREGRFLKVIYVPDDSTVRGNKFVVTAYDLIGKPLVAFRRRQRSKKGHG